MPFPSQHVKAAVVGLLAALVGGILLLVGLHLWQDHVALHVLFAIETQRQQALHEQAQKAAPLPGGQISTTPGR